MAEGDEVTTPTTTNIYNSIITSADLGGASTGLVPTQYATEIIKNVPQASVLMTRGRHVQMSSRTRTQPVLNMFPTAYWVNGDAGMKQTTKAAWSGLNMTAEELAVIIPVPEAILADSSVDVYAEILPSAIESFGKAIDDAAIFGVNKPTSWGTAIVPGALTASNKVVASTGPTSSNKKSLATDIAELGEMLASQGFNLNGFASQPGFGWKLRQLTSTSGTPIYQTDLAAGGGASLYGMPLNEVANGCWDTDQAMLIGADWSNFLVGVRQDISYKWLDQSVISDDDGKVVLNLAQQDCVALRLVMRVGFVVANPINRVEADASKRFPAAVLAPSA